MPKWLVKDCPDVLISATTNIVNKSLTIDMIIDNVFPKIPFSHESCPCKTINNNHSLDYYIVNNYRPVSNLLFLYKVIERAVVFHLNKYLINNNLDESQQSTYKSGYITKTSLVRVKKNDIMM